MLRRSDRSGAGVADCYGRAPRRIALGVTFLGEMLTRLQVLGALLVLIGVLLAQTATPAESRKAVLEEV